MNAASVSPRGLPRRSLIAEAPVAALGRAVCIALLALGCSSSSTPGAGVGSLPAGALARTGSELVSARTVSRVAAAQAVTPKVAVDLAVSDALFANAARAQLSPSSLRSLERAALARAVLEQLRHEAELAGPPSAAELAGVVKDRWIDFNRPDAVQTTHAVVMNEKPERDAAARAVAEKLQVALAHVTSSAELISTAKAFPSEGFELRAESLPFTTPDGRVLLRRDSGFVNQPGSFDVEFARAANAIAEPGQLSGIVKSAFGYHIIRLDERALGSVVPEAELPSLLAPDVFQRRAASARRELLTRSKAGALLQVDRAADDLTAQIKIEP
ncbi:MAG TPA: peptidylprolyl isomerase [Polyangiaceae bacterium]|nr:peptidylprolyl isomerase [Polyangiaceae bacterium]